ncbi:MAG: site-specific integrase [Firmicutes bacterium]|nr:site-specific integrase [Bacillota bacterium]
MQVFTVEEVEALYQAAWDDFLDNRMTIHKLSPLAVMFQFQTGIRIGELCAVRYEDIEDSEIFIDRMFRYETNEIVEYTKGKGEGRYVPLTSEAKMLIAAAREFQHERGMSETGYIFSVNDEPLSYYSVRKRYEKYCKVIGTYNKSSHKSRMTYVSALIDGGVNINTVREIAGHADEKTTYRNYCYDRKTNPERIALIEQALS